MEKTKREKRRTHATRLTSAEFDEITSAAAASGLSFACFLRRSALKVASLTVQGPAVFARDERGRRKRVLLSGEEGAR